MPYIEEAKGTVLFAFSCLNLLILKSLTRYEAIGYYSTYYYISLAAPKTTRLN
jgi:hypothetical protein